MRTVAETPIFQRYAAEIWSPNDLADFIAWIALNPKAGKIFFAKSAGHLALDLLQEG